jgi:preprotein translocase subunit YajC
MKEQQAQTRKASVGDTIETIGGVRGVVLSEDEKYIVIATGGLPGDTVPQPTTLTFLKQAIARKVEEEGAVEVESTAATTSQSSPAVENPVAELEADGSPEGEDDKK